MTTQGSAHVEILRVETIAGILEQGLSQKLLS